MALQPCTKQHLHCLAPQHIDSPPGGPNQFLLFLRRSPCLDLQRPWQTFIHPPGMTMTDLNTKRSICFPSFYFSPSVLPPSCPPPPPSPAFVSFNFILPLFVRFEQTMMKKWRLPDCNNAIPVWPWRAANSFRLFIYLYSLTYNFSFGVGAHRSLRQTQNHKSFSCQDLGLARELIFDH